MALALQPGGARPHDPRTDHDHANDWIDGVRNSRGEPCCGTNDCTPLNLGALDIADGENVRVLLDGRWYDVPRAVIVDDASPDGRTWACAIRVPSAGFRYRVLGVRCLLLPMSS